ncbi:MAG TPA: sigma-54 dependent transcriptional regulator [Gelidibacter sp.]|uniref:sigma-54-dependent transcriptional regulator n=1 Tax=Gelidibacter sp. TaxID=2018083 RepID=UPI002C08DAD1|nr:sigma-54 dependent transcriptional regulator [Gelidibacter sp.]HXJ99893.1 sigma-54 dependent transcriptional regulator [Gelidibacter sp.]
MPQEQENILIVDDDVHILELIQRHLQALHFNTFKAVSVKDAIGILKNKPIDLLITDLQMPDVDGLQLVKYVSEHFPEIPKLAVTGFPSIDGALNAMKSGVMDYLIKPFTKEELKNAVQKSLALRPAKAYKTKKNVFINPVFDELIGQSDEMLNVMNIIDKVKDNKATIFIKGESGTGKELIARAIHYSGKFAAAPFIAVNCGAIPESLLEAELFGYAKGAFTGANNNRSGFFQAANKGTLFLDEIGNASMATQLSLLRVLQQKEIMRVGSQKAEKIDVRVIAATNVDLKELIKNGRFREDLYYRLTVVQIEVPPLRDRKSDIPLLVDKFLFKYGVEYKDRIVDISDEALLALTRYDWPGNIRELENSIQRAVIMCDKRIEISNLPKHLKFQIDFPKQDIFLSLKEIEKRHILMVLEATNNNKTKAAEILQIDRKTLRDKIK